MENTIGKFNDGDIDRLQRDVRKFMSSGRELFNTVLGGSGWQANKRIWELLEGRLTSEQLFALERMLVARWGGPEAVRRLNIEDGRISFIGWMSPVSLDHFIKALRLVTAPFAEHNRTPATFVAAAGSDH